MKYFKRFILMLQFLTTIPIKQELKVDNEDFGKGLIFAPYAGLLIGLSSAAVLCISLIFLPVSVSCVLTLAAYILLSGGLHLDGLGDTFDGLFSNRPKEKILEIMRDSRIGTNALLAVIIILGLDYTCIYSFNYEKRIYTVLLFPVIGRIGSLISAGCSNYARSGEGLGKYFTDYCGIKEVVIGLALYIVIIGIPSYIYIGFSAVPLLLIPPVGSFVLIKFFSKKIGGSTGDILGAVCEISQTIFLLTAAVLFR